MCLLTLQFPAELTWLVGKEGRAVRQEAWEVWLARVISPSGLGSQFHRIAYSPQLGRSASPHGLDSQFRDREQRLQMQRALHLLREFTSFKFGFVLTDMVSPALTARFAC